MYYSIVHKHYIHRSDMYIHVYARWVGFQMTGKPGDCTIIVIVFHYNFKVEVSSYFSSSCFHDHHHLRLEFFKLPLAIMMDRIWHWHKHTMPVMVYTHNFSLLTTKSLQCILVTSSIHSDSPQAKDLEISLMWRQQTQNQHTGKPHECAS